MFLFNRKSPGRKGSSASGKLRRTEGDRAFGGAIMTPVSSFSWPTFCMVRLVPEAQALQINCGRKSVSIPYAAPARYDHLQRSPDRTERKPDYCF